MKFVENRVRSGEIGSNPSRPNALLKMKLEIQSPFVTVYQKDVLFEKFKKKTEKNVTKSVSMGCLPFFLLNLHSPASFDTKKAR